MPLTKRQREILNYLTAYTEQHRYAPSFEEIAEHFDYNSLATVHEHLSNLERKGYIKRSYNESRAIEMYYEDERLRNMSEVADLTNMVTKSNAAAGAKVKDLSKGMFMHPTDFGWQGGGRK